ncbi:hypothetical protein [Jiella sonneratiae]|uniref:Amino acid transporter protein n=1 Tax=Jiella sonneratiae TaxID=2816856 RepID=A0ABS3J4I5_9HYPH|nr:hypothetical protein [Jiella sonneratiae]MBO0904584.1 hypothetical protein [Jiella sonneratiae]
MTLPTNAGLTTRVRPGDEEARREAAKLTASYVNGVAIALAAVGGIAPVFTAIYAKQPLSVGMWRLGVVSLVCLSGSAGLHWATRSYLQRALRK